MIAIYYGNAWGSKSLPFMSSRLLLANGTAYPVSEVFEQGVLNEDALATYGVPRLTGTFAYGMFMANAAVCLPFAARWTKTNDNRLEPWLHTVFCSGVRMSSKHIRARGKDNPTTVITSTWQHTTRKRQHGGTVL